MNQIVRSYIKTAFLTLSCISPITFAQQTKTNFFETQVAFSNVAVTVNNRIGGAAFYDGRLWFGIPLIGAYVLTAGGEGLWDFADLSASSSVAMRPRLCSAIPTTALNAGICISHSTHSRYTPTVMSFTGAPTRISFRACPATGNVNCEGFTVTPQPHLLFATLRRTFAAAQESDSGFSQAVESISPALERITGITANFHYAYLTNRGATGLTSLFKAPLKHNTLLKWEPVGIDLSTFPATVVDIASSIGSNRLYFSTPNQVYYSQLDQNGTPSQPMALAMTGDAPSVIRKIAVTAGGRTMLVASPNKLYQCSLDENTPFCKALTNTGTSLTDISHLAVARSASAVGVLLANRQRELVYCRNIASDEPADCYLALKTPAPITSISTPISYNALWGTAYIVVGLPDPAINTRTTLFSCAISIAAAEERSFEEACGPAIGGESDFRLRPVALQVL